ncbi:Late embryogenesis abundant protein D-34 [Capsicum baccatum]|uniref:Late embryogenesis abundant protein D-34 n=1 Tax=Capsicum baccatum TaxID=33114 RepID=A0A2G2VYM0_CAPBA|nr:Late embryogenesis abundant protein D-34 [Capsicum baccatum]
MLRSETPSSHRTPFSTQLAFPYHQPPSTTLISPWDDVPIEAMTIGEALEAATTTGIVGDILVDESDAAAIETAEIRATGRGHIIGEGIGAAAQLA